jgi:hypothetical protein
MALTVLRFIARQKADYKQKTANGKSGALFSEIVRNSNRSREFSRKLSPESLKIYNESMSNFALMILLVLILTALGTATLVFITVKYYWGERGTPPPSGEAKRQKREEELAMRAKQIELSKKNPRKPRSSSFWDNRKSSAK